MTGGRAADLEPPGASPAPGAPRLRVDVITLFPELVEHHCSISLLGRAQREGRLEVRTHDPRRHTDDVHRSVDDAPYGGGAGMVLRPEPLFACVEAAQPPRPLLLLGPGGRRFDQSVAGELAALGGFSLLCGRYEGVDQRVSERLVDGELSIGDVVLAGGEVAANLVIEATARLVDGVCGNAASVVEESFTGGLLEHPQWTRPASFRGAEVPSALRSGDHGRIARWRHAQRLVRTARQRPDLLLARGGLDATDRRAAVDAGVEDELADLGWA